MVIQLYKVMLALLWGGGLILALVVPGSLFALFYSAITFFYVGGFVSPVSSVHMMFFLGYSTFLFLPAVLNWYYLKVDFSLFLISSISALLFLYLTRGTTVKVFTDRGNAVRLMFFCGCVVFITALLVGISATPVIAFLILLMSLSFVQGEFRGNFFVFLLFLCALSFYIFFSWSGFGRTVLMGWLLLAGLQLAYSIGFVVNKYIFSLLPGVGAAFLSGRSLVALEFKGFEAVLYDSAYGPYRLASSFIEHFEMRGYDFSGFFDQIIFTFFVFVPREVWPSKPYGFGFEYTVRHLDAYLIDAGHSIASTLIGDHIYYLGYFGVFTSLIIIAVIAMVVNLLYRIKGLNGNGVLLFSASMMVLVWGGMTSFSARVALPSIVFVVLFLALRRLLTRRVRFVWGA